MFRQYQLWILETIEKQIEKLVTFNKENGRIYWRQNPGQPRSSTKDVKK